MAYNFIFLPTLHPHSHQLGPPRSNHSEASSQSQNGLGLTYSIAQYYDSSLECPPKTHFLRCFLFYENCIQYILIVFSPPDTCPTPPRSFPIPLITQIHVLSLSYNKKHTPKMTTKPQCPVCIVANCCWAWSLPWGADDTLSFSPLKKMEYPLP